MADFWPAWLTFHCAGITTQQLGVAGIMRMGWVHHRRKLIFWLGLLSIGLLLWRRSSHGSAPVPVAASSRAFQTHLETLSAAAVARTLVKYHFPWKKKFDLRCSA